MEDLVLALKTMYGVDLGIKTENFVDLSRAVCAYAKHTIPSNWPIVGEWLYDITRFMNELMEEAEQLYSNLIKQRRSKYGDPWI